MKRSIAERLKPENPDYSPVPENVALHPFFSPLNNVAVFDHLVGEARLATAKLIFLTGITVSHETMQAVSTRFQEGATCVALRSLAGNVATGKSSGGTVIVPKGTGKWVITDDFGDPTVRAQIERFLGDSQEIRFRLGKHELRMRTVDGDRNHVRVED
jgi:hypothetical protein